MSVKAVGGKYEISTPTHPPTGQLEDGADILTATQRGGLSVWCCNEVHNPSRKLNHDVEWEASLCYGIAGFGMYNTLLSA